MLILLSFANRRRRRARALWMALFVSAVFLDRLAALHAPVAAERGAASAWVHEGAPPPVIAGHWPGHARFTSQRRSDDPSLGDQSAFGLTADLLGSELPADFPYAQR